MNRLIASQNTNFGEKLQSDTNFENFVNCADFYKSQYGFLIV